MNTDDVTRSAFGIALDAALRDQARATAAVDYLREKIAALGPVEAEAPSPSLPTVDPAGLTSGEHRRAVAAAATKGRAGGLPTICPDCRKPMGSVAGLSAHRRSAHPAKAKGAASIAQHQATEAERVRAVAAEIRAREPAVHVNGDGFAARHEEAARARAAAAWAERHPEAVA